MNNGMDMDNEKHMKNVRSLKIDCIKVPETSS